MGRSSANFCVLILGMLLAVCDAVLEHRDWTQANSTAQITNIATLGIVAHMERDWYIPGNLLVCDMRALLTTDLKTTDLVIGQHKRWHNLPYREGRGSEAVFGVISSFAQVNASHVVIADKGFSCLRMLDRANGTTSLIAGICGTPSKFIRDDNSTFHEMAGIVYVRGKVYVAEPVMQSIRKVDILNNQISSVVTRRNFANAAYKPLDLLVDPMEENIYVSITNGIGRLSLHDDKFQYISGGDSPNAFYGYSDGFLATSEWYYPHGMVFADNNTMIVADSLNMVLRAVEFGSIANVSTWHISDDDDCEIGNGDLYRPEALCFFDENKLLVSVGKTRGGAIMEINLSKELFPHGTILQSGSKGVIVGLSVAAAIVLPFTVATAAIFYRRRKLRTTAATANEIVHNRSLYQSIKGERTQKDNGAIKLKSK